MVRKKYTTIIDELKMARVLSPASCAGWKQVQERFPGVVSATPLCVIDDYSAPRLEEMIDFYYDEGFEGVGLIRMKPLGFARKEELKFDITRFMAAYLKGLEYILSSRI